jgi:hypothetical protein
MTLVQALTYRQPFVSRPVGPIRTPRCMGRCCGTRTAPVWLTFGSHGLRLLCADCRAGQSHIIRRTLSEIRRT